MPEPDRTPDDLALPAEAWADAANLLRRLVGVELRTISGGRRNVILAVSPPTVLVRTERSPQGQPVPIADLEHALHLLWRDGFVTIHPDVVGHRSSFLGAVLRTLPGSTVKGSPPCLELGAEKGVSHPLSDIGKELIFDGELSRGRTVQERLEQVSLRLILFGTEDSATCALCGEVYPVSFLWAAHIKKRSLCSDSERRDLAHIAMPACVFGCDALFETGLITVNDGGIIIGAGGVDGIVGRRIEDLRGRHCLAHSAESEPYFRWHQINIFRGQDLLNVNRSTLALIRFSIRKSVPPYSSLVDSWQLVRFRRYCQWQGLVIGND